MYNGLTIADKGALEDAQRCGMNWMARDWNGSLYGYADKPQRNGDSRWFTDGSFYSAFDDSLSFIQWTDSEPVHVPTALAQIAEMERESEKQTRAMNAMLPIYLGHPETGRGQTIYGYPIEHLQKIAMLLRDERVTVADLKKCVENFEFCAETVLRMAHEDIESGAGKCVESMQRHASPYTEGETT